MKRQPQAIRALLGQNSTLAKLQRQNRQLQQLCKAIRQCLPTTAAPHLLSCSYNESTLTLYALSAAQATALRLGSHRLLQHLQEEQHSAFPAFKRLRIRISVNVSPPKLAEQPAGPSFLANSTATLISELAETVIDPALRDILRRLASRRKGPNTDPGSSEIQ